MITLTQRYTLRYKSHEGTLVELFNLSEAGRRDIEATQTLLGSTDFETIPQRGNYSQWEIDLVRTKARQA